MTDGVATGRRERKRIGLIEDAKTFLSEEKYRITLGGGRVAQPFGFRPH
jgi:hypothetical protein